MKDYYTKLFKPQTQSTGHFKCVSLVLRIGRNGETIYGGTRLHGATTGSFSFCNNGRAAGYHQDLHPGRRTCDSRRLFVGFFQSAEQILVTKGFDHKATVWGSVTAAWRSSPLSQCF